MTKKTKPTPPKTETKDYDSLIEAYPVVFGSLSYIACGTGWYDLLEGLAKKLEVLIVDWFYSQPSSENICEYCNEARSKHSDEPPIGYNNSNSSQFHCLAFRVGLPTAEQVKEKFGGLRWYSKFHIEGMNELITEAESMSFKICEYCGKEGKPGGKGWIKTLCSGCRRKETMTRNKSNRHMQMILDGANLSALGQPEVTKESTDSSITN